MLWKPPPINEPGYRAPQPWLSAGIIECSGYVGSTHEVFDIHGGGIDLLFPITNEVAQRRAAPSATT